MTQKILTLLLSALLAVSSIPSWAMAAEELTIELQIDNPVVKINGADSTVEAPYLYEGTTLVPLRVITTAFGAVPEWDGETQTITLKYGDKVIKLTIGSKEADVNGEAAALPVPPQLNNGTTMVPIRFISENFGAKVSYNDEQKIITITGEQLASGSGVTTIDIDANKTKIGNSHYGWTMNYPPGLVTSNSSFREDWYKFEDAKGEYTLYVQVDEDQDTLSKDQLLKRLANEIKDAGEKILEQRTVNESPSYAKVVSMEDDYYTEHRSYQKGERIYTIRLVVEGKENYQNEAKSKSNAALLNSFKLSYDSSDDAIKNLSTVKNGFRTFTSEEFGLSINIPAKWDTGDVGEYLLFADEEYTSNVVLRVTSIAKGDTLNKWVEREIDYYETEYLSEYMTLDGPSSVKIDNVTGQQVRITLKNGNYTEDSYISYFFRGTHKYEIQVNFDEDNDSPRLADQILKSIVFTGEQNDAIGHIEDTNDFLDRNKLTETRLRSLNLALKLPAHIERKDEGSSEELAVFGSANNSIIIEEISDVADTPADANLFARGIAEQLEDDLKNYKLISDTSEDIAGVSAKKLVISGHNSSSGKAHVYTIYIFGRQGKYYLLYSAINQIAYTDANKEMLNSIFKSVRFLG